MSQRDDADRRRAERRARRIAHGRIALAATTGLLAGAGMMLARSVRERGYRDVSGHARELSNLLALAQSIVAAPDLSSAVDRLLHAAARAARSQWSAVYLVDPINKDLVLAGSRGEAEAGVLPESIPLTSTQHVSTDRALPGSKGGPHSVLCVPMTCQGEPVGLIVTGRRISERYRPEESASVSRLAIHSSDALRRIVEIEELRGLAARDPLTGLDNKLRFLEALTEECARAARYNHPLSLLMLDLDRFKSYNDNHGHPAGDKRLQRLSEVLRKVVRASDRPSRIGGDEFAVLCPMTGLNDAVAIAERIRSMMADDPATTVSIGSATFPIDATTSESLFSIADTALYAAKRAGGDQVCSVGKATGIGQL